MSRKEKDPNIECFYETTITYTCPKRGKVTETVKVKKYKAQVAPENKPTDPIIGALFNQELLDEFEENGFHEDVQP
jgi:hypothetical protein